jgi:hypothetical protein
MGACFDSTFLKSHDVAAAKEEFRRVCEDRAWECGHGGYTGTLAETHGRISFFHSLEFDSRDDAEDWIDENADKWGPALAVRIKGMDGWFAGAICSS